MFKPYQPPITVQNVKLSAPVKSDGSWWLKEKVFSNQLGLYMLANDHLIPNAQGKIVLSPSYLTVLLEAEPNLWHTIFSRGNQCNDFGSPENLQPFNLTARRNPRQISISGHWRIWRLLPGTPTSSTWILAKPNGKSPPWSVSMRRVCRRTHD